MIVAAILLLFLIHDMLRVPDSFETMGLFEFG